MKVFPGCLGRFKPVLPISEGVYFNISSVNYTDIKNVTVSMFAS